jgi:FkbM family methyltransferase
MSYPEEKAAIQEILKTFEHPVIVDLGAHQGTDEEWMLESCKPETLVMVEADEKNFRVLANKFFPDKEVFGFASGPSVLDGGKVILSRNAIAPYDGLCDFYSSEAEGGGYGSIYRPIGGLNAPVESFTHNVRNTVSMKFDTLFDALQLDHIDLLWVDIHGAEKDMIAHGQKALAKTGYLFIEFFNDRKYEGMATGEELKAMLPEWELMQTFPWNMLLRNKNTT